MTYKEIAAFVASIAEALGCGYHYYDEGEKDVIKTPYLLLIIRIGMTSGRTIVTMCGYSV